MSKIINVRIPNTLIGLGAINNIGDVVRDLSPSKVLIVTDPVIKKVGLTNSISSLLRKARYVFDVYDECESNASVKSLERLVKRIKSGKYDLLIGIGGGSVLDSTKVASLVAANQGLSLYDLLDGKSATKAIAKILIPTTAGTGSEWSTVGMVSDDRTGGQKKAITSAKNVPEGVIVDPELTINLPQKVTADTGMDALVHAIEAYTSSNANIFSDMFALTALELISQNILQAYSKGKQNIGARYNMSVGASIAMYAVAVSGVGIAHFMGHPLEKRAHVSHGVSCTLMLPYVMEFNLIACPEKFARIAEVMGESVDGLSVFDAAAKSIEAVKRISRPLGIPQTLSDIGIKKTQIREMAEEMLDAYGVETKSWNPREVSVEDTVKIYTSAL